jgi:hypothetical protein
MFEVTRQVHGRHAATANLTLDAILVAERALQVPDRS